jgi:hypothetical protein
MLKRLRQAKQEYNVLIKGKFCCFLFLISVQIMFFIIRRGVDVCSEQSAAVCMKIGIPVR